MTHLKNKPTMHSCWSVWLRLQVYKSNTYHSLRAVRAPFPLSASTRTRKPLGDSQATRPDQPDAGVSRARRNSRRFRTHSGSLCLRGGLARSRARSLQLLVRRASEHPADGEKRFLLHRRVPAPATATHRAKHSTMCSKHGRVNA